MLERLLAAFVALLAALERVAPVIAAFMAGKGAAEFKAMEEQLEKERQLSDLERDLTAFHDSLSDGELRNITAQRIKRLRYKARTAHGIGGHDD